jgi:hypothetical protein
VLLHSDTLFWFRENQSVHVLLNAVCFAREYRRDNQKWAIQRNGQHWVHKTQDEDKQNKNTTQYVLDTTMRKRTQITDNIIITLYRGFVFRHDSWKFAHGAFNNNHSFITISYTLCVLQRGSTYQLYSLWFDPTGFEPTIYRPRGEHCEVTSLYLPVVSACTIYFENVLLIRNFQTFCQFCIRYSNEWVIVVKRTVSKLSAIMAKHETSV